MYKPDKWIILQLKGEKDQIIYKVLAGWNGGYLDGASWKINSGITKITEEGEYYNIEGYSGNVYQCHKKCYGTNAISASILAKIQKDPNFQDKVEVLLFQDFTSLLKDKK